MTPLEELAVRVERAEGPDRELDRDIKLAVCAGNDWSRASAEAAKVWALRYTASLDAAMTLVPEGAHIGMGADATGPLKGWAWVRAKIDDTWEEFSSPQRKQGSIGYVEPYPASMALALTAACLRARSPSSDPAHQER